MTMIAAPLMLSPILSFAQFLIVTQLDSAISSKTINLKLPTRYYFWYISKILFGYSLGNVKVIWSVGSTLAIFISFDDIAHKIYINLSASQ